MPPSVQAAGAQGGTSAFSTRAALSFVSCIRLLGGSLLVRRIRVTDNPNGPNVEQRPEHVGSSTVLDNPAVNNLVHIDAGEDQFPSGRPDAKPLSLVSAAGGDLGNHPLILGDLPLDGQPQIRVRRPHTPDMRGHTVDALYHTQRAVRLDAIRRDEYSDALYLVSPNVQTRPVKNV